MREKNLTLKLEGFTVEAEDTLLLEDLDEAELLVNHAGIHQFALLLMEDCEESLLMEDREEFMRDDEVEELLELCAKAVESDTNAKLPARNTEVALFIIRKWKRNTCGQE